MRSRPYLDSLEMFALEEVNFAILRTACAIFKPDRSDGILTVFASVRLPRHPAGAVDQHPGA